MAFESGFCWCRQCLSANTKGLGLWAATTDSRQPGGGWASVSSSTSTTLQLSTALLRRLTPTHCTLARLCPPSSCCAEHRSWPWLLHVLRVCIWLVFVLMAGVGFVSCNAGAMGQEPKRTANRPLPCQVRRRWWRGPVSGTVIPLVPSLVLSDYSDTNQPCTTQPSPQTFLSADERIWIWQGFARDSAVLSWIGRASPFCLTWLGRELLELMHSEARGA